MRNETPHVDGGSLSSLPKGATLNFQLVVILTGGLPKIFIMNQFSLYTKISNLIAVVTDKLICSTSGRI